MITSPTNDDDNDLIDDDNFLCALCLQKGQRSASNAVEMSQCVPQGHFSRVCCH